MATAAAAPDNAFLCATPAPGRGYHPEGIELTYAAVRAEVLRLRDAYEAAGYGHGHRVALLFENRPEFFFHYLALNGLGAGVVPVNPDYRYDELSAVQVSRGRTRLVARDGRVRAVRGVRGAVQGNRFRARVLARATEAAAGGSGRRGPGNPEGVPRSIGP